MRAAARRRRCLLCLLLLLLLGQRGGGGRGRLLLVHLALVQQVAELALGAGQKRAALPQAGLDGRLLLPLLGDQLGGVALLALQLRLAGRDLALGRRHLLQQRMLRCADPLDVLDARDQIGERPGSEHVGGGVVVDVGALVGVDHEHGQLRPRHLQVVLGDPQLDRVLLDLVADVGEVLLGAVVGLDRGLEPDVHRVQLLLDRPHLGAGIADLAGVGGPRQGGCGKGRNHDQSAGAADAGGHAGASPFWCTRRHGGGLYQAGWTPTKAICRCLRAANSHVCSPLDTFVSGLTTAPARSRAALSGFCSRIDIVGQSGVEWGEMGDRPFAARRIHSTT